LGRPDFWPAQIPGAQAFCQRNSQFNQKQPDARTSARRQDADDALALMRGRGFDLRNRLQLLDDVVDHLSAFLDVGHFAAAEDHRNDQLILVEQKGPRLIQLEGNVVFASFGANADFLDLALVRVALVLPLLLLVLELPVVHDAAHGRPLIGSYFDQIQLGFARSRQCLVRADDAQRLALGRNDANRRNTDLLVDPLIAFYTKALSRKTLLPTAARLMKARMPLELLVRLGTTECTAAKQRNIADSPLPRQLVYFN
jgi:hypothetical protein